ncbi:NYN domain-containing protein [Trinickia dinghuensis]|nr:NYN domain-containing protein [Trinickia dinghuensis]
MAVFCDFENVALGVRDAKFEKFDIKPVLERLLLKGSIVVKKAYCDWDRYKGFKASMHEASFELIEIPHVRQSGKNSADIRLVVDALDLCYTKSHVDTFVIISGDSDFSPLVSKLRENAKKVIGVGVKNSTSDLLVANCDEFIFYDDLAREHQRATAKREAREANAAAKRPTDEDKQPKAEMESRKAKAIAIAVETFDALASERGESGKIWASVLKSAIKRRKPDFSESYYGFRAFGNLLDEAQARGLLEVGRDDKSGAFVYRPSQPASASVSASPDAAKDGATHGAVQDHNGASTETGGHKGRKKSKSARKPAREQVPVAAAAEVVTFEATHETTAEPVVTAEEPAVSQAVPSAAAPKPRRTARKASAKKPASTASRGGAEERNPQNAQTAQGPDQAAEPAATAEVPPKAKPARAPRKSAPRTNRPRKNATENNSGQ